MPYNTQPGEVLVHKDYTNETHVEASDVLGVHVQISADSRTLWVNVNGKCLLRVSGIAEIDLEDQRYADLLPVSYRVTSDSDDPEGDAWERAVTVERREQRDGTVLWSINKGDRSCWYRDDEQFGYEPMPSGRDEAFIKNTRFCFADAVKFARIAKEKINRQWAEWKAAVRKKDEERKRDQT